MRRNGDWRDPFSDSFHEGIFTLNKKRNIGPKLSAPGGEILTGDTEIPEPVEADQRGGRVGRSAAEAGAGWNTLRDADFRAFPAPGLFLQEPCGPQTEIGGVIRHVSRADQTAFGPLCEAYGVRERDQQKDGFEQVITILPDADDMEKEAGRSRKAFGRSGCIGVSLIDSDGEADRRRSSALRSGDTDKLRETVSRLREELNPPGRSRQFISGRR